MYKLLSEEEKHWIYEQIEITSNTTPEERLDYLSSLQELFLIGAKQRKKNLDFKKLEEELNIFIRFHGF